MIWNMIILFKNVLVDLATAKYNVIGLISGFGTWMMSNLSAIDPTSLTSWVGIAITASIGVFSVLKVRQEWLKKKQEDQDAHKARLAEQKRIQDAFEAEQKRIDDLHNLEIQNKKQ